MSLRGALAALLAALCAVLLFPLPCGADARIDLGIGEHRLLRRDAAIQKAAIGDPAIADVEVVSEHELLVQGRTAGTTTLILWIGDERERLHVVVRSTSAALDAAVQRAGGAQLRTDAKGGLQGMADSLPGLAAAHALLSAGKNLTTINDASQVALDTQVQIDLRIVELRRQRLRAAGFQFVRSSPGSAQSLSPPGGLSGIRGNGAVSGETSFSFGSPSGFLPLVDGFNLVGASAGGNFAALLSLLETNGYAHTLAEPTLVTTSGQSASFLAGGEFPVPVAQSGSSGQSSITVEYREFGVRVTLHPIVLSADHIVLKVAPEVSELDFSTGVFAGGVAVPALTTRRADTTVELGDGETFVIGGLIRRDLTSTLERIPALGELPILGPFFRRVRYSNEESELLMIVSPRLVRPIARGAALPPLPGADAESFSPSKTDVFLRGRVSPPESGFAD